MKKIILYSSFALILSIVTFFSSYNYSDASKYALSENNKNDSREVDNTEYSTANFFDKYFTVVKYEDMREGDIIVLSKEHASDKIYIYYGDNIVSELEDGRLGNKRTLTSSELSDASIKCLRFDANQFSKDVGNLLDTVCTQ